MNDLVAQELFDDLLDELPDAPVGERHSPLERIQLDFDPKLAFDIALQYDPVPVVLRNHGVTADQYAQLKAHRPFLLAIKNFRDEIREKGVTFKMKAKMLAEDLLEDAYLMSRNPDTPASVRMKGIENVVRWAEHEPRKDTGGGDGTSFNIQINLGD